MASHKSAQLNYLRRKVGVNASGVFASGVLCTLAGVRLLFSVVNVGPRALELVALPPRRRVVSASLCDAAQALQHEYIAARGWS